MYFYSRERLAEALQLIVKDKIDAATATLNQYSLFNIRITDLTNQSTNLSLPDQVTFPNIDVTEVQSQLLKSLVSEYNNSWRK